ncbi:hypothetical protein J6590_076638 [Homalodisca vitripennis]|nr:hypothetical protein J6590_076638 [Homalodisca vitripennis]
MEERVKIRSRINTYRLLYLLPRPNTTRIAHFCNFKILCNKEGRAVPLKITPYDITVLIQLENEISIHPISNAFLGLTLDDKLKFYNHTENVSDKVSSGIFAIRTLVKSSNSDVLLSAYYGLIYPHLVYGLPIWGCENKRICFCSA